MNHPKNGNPNKKTVALIFGGKSPEHEVSLNSARNVYAALDKNLFDAILIGISKSGTWYLFNDEQLKNTKSILDEKCGPKSDSVALISKENQATLVNLKNFESVKVDLAFPILHGTYGEDGCIQGLFKMVNLPFVGCDVMASAVGMDKDVMKRLFVQAEIPTARFITLSQYETPDYNLIASRLGLPFFLKPANMGSSVGVHKVKNENDFKLAIADAFKYDTKLVIEEFIEGREIECSIKGLLHNPTASVAGEVIPQHEFYSYEAKYLDDNGAAIQIPAKITEDQLAKIQNIAIKTYRTLGCEGLTRVDFFMKKDGEILVNEVNTIPGFTKISMYPKMWEASGVSYSNLITELLNLSLDKHKLVSKLNTSFLNLEK